MLGKERRDKTGKRLTAVGLGDRFMTLHSSPLVCTLRDFSYEKGLRHATLPSRIQC